MTRLRIFGDSHCGCIKRAVDARIDELPETEMFGIAYGQEMQSKFFVVDEAAKVITTMRDGDPETTEVLPRPGDRAEDPDIRYFYSGPLTFSVVANAVTWGHYVPWNLKTKPSEIPLSEQAIEGWFKQNIDFAVEFAATMRSLGMDLHVIEGPRPFDNIVDGRLFSLDLIMHISDRFFDYGHSRLDAAGIPVVRQPPQTLTDHGTTRAEFDHDDPTDRFHANEIYGSAMLDEILKTL